MVTCLSNLYSVLSYIGIIGFFAIAIAVFKTKRSLFRGVFLSAASGLAAFVFSVMEYNVRTGENIIDLFINEQFTSLSKVIGSMGSDALSSTYGISTEEMLESLNSVREMYSLVFPSVIVLTSLFLSFVFYMFVKTILRIMQKDVSAFTDFIDMRMPKSSVLVLVICMIVSAVSDGAAGSICLNIVLVITSIMSLCGFAYVLYWLKMRVKTPFLRALSYTGAVFAVIVFFNFALYILSMISIADTFLDLRNKWSKGGFDEQTREEQ